MAKEQHALQENLNGLDKHSKLYEIQKKGFERDFEDNISKYTDVGMDAVTIRNRKWPPMQKEQTLWGVIKRLECAGFQYAAVHGYFCRGAEGSHQISTNTNSV